MAKISGRQFDKQVRRRNRQRFGRTMGITTVPIQLERPRKEEIGELAEAVADEHCPAEVVEPEAIA